MDEIEQTRVALDAQAAAWIAIVGEYDRSEQWCGDGYGSVEGAIADLCRMDRGVVSMDVKLAASSRSYPSSPKRSPRGRSPNGTSVIATAATPARMAEFTNLENEFVEVARKCPPKELADVVRYVTDALDGDGGAGAEEKICARRRYHQSRTLDAMLATNGLFDPESAEFAESALKTARGSRRTRSRDPYRAAAERGCVHDDHAPMARAHRREHARSCAEPGDHCRRPRRNARIGPDLIAQAREERRRDGHLSRATLERIACDGNISRAIMFGKSEVLDLGRTTRIASPAQFPRSDRPRSALPSPRLQGTTPALSGAPQMALDPGRTHRPRQSRTALLVPPPPTTSSGWLAGGPSPIEVPPPEATSIGTSRA